MRGFISDVLEGTILAEKTSKEGVLKNIEEGNTKTDVSAKIISELDDAGYKALLSGVATEGENAWKFLITEIEKENNMGTGYRN